MLIECLASPHGGLDETSHARIIERVYALGVRPDWWMIEAQPNAAAWRNIGATIASIDRHCRGVLAIARSSETFASELALARGLGLIKGFAAGRLVFGEVIEAWMKNEINSKIAVARMAGRFAALAKTFDAAVPGAGKDLS